MTISPQERAEWRQENTRPISSEVWWCCAQEQFLGICNHAKIIRLLDALEAAEQHNRDAADQPKGHYSDSVRSDQR